MKAYIREQALARGADPNIAIKVARSEGLKPGTWQSEYYKNGKRETSYGPFQLLVGGGLGDKFIQKTGLHPSDPSSWKEQVQFALDEAIKGGWGPWYGAAKVGVGKWDGLSGAQPLGITESTAEPEAETEAVDPFSILSPDLARPGSTRIAESAAYFPEAPEVAASPAMDMLGAPTGLPEPIQARFDGAPPPTLREPNPARFEGTPAPMLGAPTGLREPIAARFDGAPFPTIARGGMQPFGGVPTPGLSPISLAFDPSLASVPPNKVQTSVLGLPPADQPVAANNFGLAHGQPGFAGGVPAHEVSYLTQQGERVPPNRSFSAPFVDASRFQFAQPASAPERVAPADARFSGPTAPKGDRLPSALPSREMLAMDARSTPAAPPSVAERGGSFVDPRDLPRMAAARPTDGTPYAGPGSAVTMDEVERSKQAWMADQFKTAADPRAVPPGYADNYRQASDSLMAAHVKGLDGRMAPADPAWSGVVPKAPVTPMMANGRIGSPAERGPDAAKWMALVPPSSVKTSRETRAALPTASGFSMPVLPATVMVGSRADDTLPEIATRGPGRQATAPRRTEPVRLANPISVGQPGGKYGGTGLNAMMGVRSGMSPVGTVARSASNPDVMAVSLPHGNVAHVNTKHGFISTWSPADDDERGTVFGSKVVAIDPTGTQSKYVSAAKAQELAAKGWTTYGPGTPAGPSKGFAKSTGPSSGFLSGLFGGGKSGSRGPSFGGPLGGLFSGLFGQSRQATDVSVPGGIFGGLFGPSGPFGNAGVGLGGGIGGGGGGIGGIGNPGFGGGKSENYSGL